MAITPLKNPEDLSPETLSNCRACYEVRDLYWEREESQDPKRIAEIDRMLVDYLLVLDKPVMHKGRQIRLLEHIEPKFTPEEIGTLRFRRQMSDEVRAKLRIFCADFTNRVIGT